MPGIDHRAGKDFIETFMIDRCVVTRDPQSVYDNVLDRATGKLVPPDNDNFPIYQGKCVVKRPRSDTAQPVVQAGQELGLRTYKVLLPWDESEVRLGDMITISRSRDPFIQGKRMRILDADGGTHALYRTLFCTDLEGALPFEG